MKITMKQNKNDYEDNYDIIVDDYIDNELITNEQKKL